MSRKLSPNFEQLEFDDQDEHELSWDPAGADDEEVKKAQRRQRRIKKSEDWLNVSRL